MSIQRPSLWLPGAAVAAIVLSGCPSPYVVIQHSPVVAKSSETVTFTAEVRDDGTGPANVEILVNAARVKTCRNLRTGDTCSYTGGPYRAYQGTTVSFLAKATDRRGRTDTRGYYYFAVTDNVYGWGVLKPIPARYVGPVGDKFDLAFHRDSDYADFGDFVDDVEDKLYDVYSEQAIIELPDNFDKFNFWIYPQVASSSGCGTVGSDADTSMPWRDADAILHTASLQDCTSDAHFSAEGHNTKAFLHESGHGVFGLADEYDGCYTYYFEPSPEPNIFDLETTCQAEQTAKSRAPGACWQFTACQGGWWGIHQLTDSTVMIRGMVGDAWGIEGTERVEWFFEQLP